MADEIRVEPEAPISDEPEVARAEIAMTRARMSDTIDEIEDALILRKERLQDRMDILSPVRERPLQAAGAVFGVGLLLGLLTGGGDDADELEYDVEFEYEGGVDLDAERRAELWENRARRLLSIARDQRASARGLMDGGDDWSMEYDEDDSEAGTGALAGLKDAIADRVAPVLGAMMRQFIGGNSRA